MKLFFYFCLTFIWLSLQGQPNEGLPAGRYGIKSGKIVYHFNNLFQAGTKTVIFDDSGRYVKVIIEAHLIVPKEGFASIDSNFKMAVKEKSNQLIIHTPDMEYMEDLDSLRGFRAAPRPLAAATNFFDSAMRVVGKDTVLGRPCVVTEINGAIRNWSWAGIDLKTENVVEGMGPKVQVVAIFIDEHYRIKPDEFQIPGNAKVETQ